MFLFLTIVTCYLIFKLLAWIWKKLGEGGGVSFLD